MKTPERFEKDKPGQSKEFESKAEGVFGQDSHINDDRKYRTDKAARPQRYGADFRESTQTVTEKFK
jgi:hypothetical protein